MNSWLSRNKTGLLAIALVAAVTAYATHRFEKPGQLDVVTAQAMDMSLMRPPTGAAPVALASIRLGTLSQSVTYTGSVQPFNEQEISPRIAGTILRLPVYPGDRVEAGQLLAQLDSGEVAARTDAAKALAMQAEMSLSTSALNHHLHHYAALDQATAQVEVSEQAVDDAGAQVAEAADAVSDAQSGVESAKASSDYWAVEIRREKQLVDAGAASRQEYQSEVSQAAAAQAGLDSARDKLREARASARSAASRLAEAQRQVDAAQAGKRMASADLEVAASQDREAAAAAAAAIATAREASVVQSYTRILSPMSGVVTERPVAPGTLVQPGTVILEIAEIERVRVQANVAASDLDGIRTGNPVEIVSADGGKRVRAKVTAVFPSAGAETRTAVIEALIDNVDGRWIPGESVSMTIQKSRPVTDTAAFIVPAGAIVSEGGLSYLWVAGRQDPGPRYRAVCGTTYTAAEAKKLHYICPMDHKPLTPLRRSAADGPDTPMTAIRVEVQVGATDGASTEVRSDSLMPDDKIVAQGMAGLSEGVRLIETPWGVDGPLSLPTAVQANAGQTVYRCEKCGMTYSAADAAKDRYIDPMDGGRLVPVKEGK